MKSERIDISEQNLGAIFASRGLLFDTNVWLRVDGYFTDSNDKRSRTYSWLYKIALERQHPIYLPQVVASEYVKVSLAAMAEQTDWKPGGRIKIHQHPDYSEWIRDVSDCLYHVNESATRINDDFAEIDFDACLKQCQEHSIDFNDVLIADLCRRYELTLVSDDADLTHQAVRIATANRRLLVGAQ